MDNKLYQLLLVIEEYILCYIEQSEDYEDYETVEEYMNRQEPEIRALYECFLALSNKYFPEEE